MTDVDDDEPSFKRICHRCVREAYLAAEIHSSGEVAVCDYCSGSAATYGLDQLADRIEQAFDEHYVRTNAEPEYWEERVMADPEWKYSWSRKGMETGEAIQIAAGISEQPAIDVAEILEERHAQVDPKDYLGEESEFASTAHYERSRPSFIGLHSLWHEFERSLKARARFFSASAESLLSQVFGGIDAVSTQDGRCLVVEIGPGTPYESFYRARSFQADDCLSDALCRPSERLGPPPFRAAKAGRMNAQGISVFYGATTQHVALAEVRPPVGARVAVAKFEVTRSVRVLDLTAASQAHAVGSVFDPSFLARLHRVDFLRTLTSRMARPVMPDEEGLDYLPTQVVSDFLSSANKPSLDGIIFPSVQARDGCNVVLFHGAARVARDDVAPGTKIYARLGLDNGDGWEADYSVDLVVPRGTAQLAGHDDEDLLPGLLQGGAIAESEDEREESLRVIADSLVVHHVLGVEVKTTVSPVRRHVSVSDQTS